MILSIYLPSNRDSKYIKQNLTDTKEEIDKATSIGVSTTSSSQNSRTTNKAISIDTDVNNKIKQQDLKDTTSPNSSHLTEYTSANSPRQTTHTPQLIQTSAIFCKQKQCVF